MQDNYSSYVGQTLEMENAKDKKNVFMKNYKIILENGSDARTGQRWIL
jgi:hypothetical protein